MFDKTIWVAYTHDNCFVIIEIIHYFVYLIE